MRVVLDTNALVSALLFAGVSSKLVPLWQSRRIVALVSRGILEEYLRVLSYLKFKLSEAEIKDLLQEEVLPFVDVIVPRRRLRVVKRDPSDDQFIECAVAGRAKVIISGDKDLLSIGSYRKIMIQTPAQFLAGFPSQR